MPEIRVESILGGQAPLTSFAAHDQFRASLGVDPALPLTDNNDVYSTIGSGAIRPVASENISGTTIVGPPAWIVPQPKTGTFYVYGGGSTYSVDSTLTSISGLSDGGTLTLNVSSGAAYYDNYLYLAKATDIARYGPLDGAAVFTGTYWTGTLGLAALTNTTYPTNTNGTGYPNHVMHRHSDGKLYIGDVVGNKGTIHYIATKKTAVEGDTNDGSTANKLQFGYGLWPTALESYGSELAVALYEGDGTNAKQQRAKLAFWDTTSTNFNKIVWVEYPDPFISALRNINGVLYVISGSVNQRGFRICKFLGGYTFEEVWYSEVGEPPLAGAVDGSMNRLLIGGATTIPESDGCVWSVGLQKRALGQGLFNVMRITGGTASSLVTSLKLVENNRFGYLSPLVGWSNGIVGGANNGLDRQGTAYNNAPSVWWSQTYRIGQPFKITKIRILLAQAMAANMTITPKIYTDDGASSTTLATLNNTNYPNNNLNIVLRPNGLTGQHNFWLELRWTGSALATVNLPLSIDYEFLAD